jgi:acetolactate synthase I/II/III large subunit
MMLFIELQFGMDGLKMKVSDYISKRVVELGIKHVFMVTGGGAMHLNHSLGINNNLECIFNHHEQACAMAAESYYRLNNKLALVNVTSGPGGTNAITGVYGAFVDSIGMVVLSGQVKFETTVRSTGMSLRQYGDQELDIVPLIKPITKYATMVTDVNTVGYHLEKAFYLAASGRPGPCWLDIPLNIQAADIDPNEQLTFDPSEITEIWEKTPNITNYCIDILERIRNSERPVIYAGSGVRLSGAHDDFINLVNKLGVPVVSAWNAHDVICDSHSQYIGRPGTVGDRAGNFAVQNADLLLILGSRLNIRQVSYNWDSFAKNSQKIWIDVDEAEMNKPTVKADLKICADLGYLLPALVQLAQNEVNTKHQEWTRWCMERRNKYPVVLNEYFESKKLNPYVFLDTLFKGLKENDITVTANGSACVISFQVAEIKTGQRLWTNSGCASMGYDLPAAIGACYASNLGSVICIAGDGSIMMNIQELQTISSFNLPIKIFIHNNNGYLSINQVQRKYFNGEEVGSGPESGVILPDFSKISESFGIQYCKIDSNENLKVKIDDFLNLEGPAICEVLVDEHQEFAPKLSSKVLDNGQMISPPLEDLSPFLSSDELESNMIKM